MNQVLLHHLELMNNEKYFQFAFVPGQPSFDDLFAALEAFKVEIEKLKVLEEERVAQKAKDDAITAASPVEPVVVEPEVVA